MLLFIFSGQPRSSLETKKNSITDDYTISQTVLGLGINGKGGLISEEVIISVKSSIRFEPNNCTRLNHLIFLPLGYALSLTDFEF